MNAKQITNTNRIIKNNRGIATTADFLAEGMSKTDISKLVQAGVLERIRQGFYQLADDTSISEAQYLAALLPDGIVCVESALFYYNYSDFAPRVWTIAVPRSISLTRLKFDVVPVKAYFVQKENYELGKTIANFEGTQLFIYDRERTVCDCFKYRTRLDNETFNKAVNAYVADEKKNLSNLSRYAKELGLYKRVMDLMEVMLNG